MENLEYALVTLRNNKQYFVLENVLYQYDTYDLILNVEDEEDIKIVLQEIKNGKTVFTPVEDKTLLNNLSQKFYESIKIKQQSIK